MIAVSKRNTVSLKVKAAASTGASLAMASASTSVEVISELTQLSWGLLQTLLSTTSRDKYRLCSYLSSQFIQVCPEIWKRYRTRLLLFCGEMVMENVAANAVERQDQQQQPQQHVHMLDSRLLSTVLQKKGTFKAEKKLQICIEFAVGV